MRLFHLGLDVSMVGDMTTPSIGPADLLVVSAGPGGFSTVNGLMGVARAAGARIALVTANPGGGAARLADTVLVVPAQTMANDVGGASVLPMGSLFEGPNSSSSRWPSWPWPSVCISMPTPCAHDTRTWNRAGG